MSMQKKNHLGFSQTPFSDIIYGRRVENSAPIRSRQAAARAFIYRPPPPPPRPQNTTTTTTNRSNNNNDK